MEKQLKECGINLQGELRTSQKSLESTPGSKHEENIRQEKLRPSVFEPR